jgi:hypothetical protein
MTTDSAETAASARQIMNGEKLFSLTAIAANLPGHRDNEHANASTVFRWIVKGVRVGGKLIKLEAVRLGATWRTSQEAVARFSARLTEASLPAAAPPAPPEPTAKQRGRAAAAASKKAGEIFGN